MNSKMPVSTKHDLIKELTEIETELERNIETTLWISDPHGAGDRFVAILKGRFGLVWQSAKEALPGTFSPEKIVYIDRIIRKEKYFESDMFAMHRQDVISALITIIRYKIQNIKDFDRIRLNINKDLKPLLENLILNFTVPNIVYENDIVADKIISALAKIVKQVILGHLIVLGDVFDRGDEPDKILRILASREIRPYVQFVWGNHDILWMGAAAGSRSLIAEALRISTRYDNLEFLERLNIDISKLKNFATELYPGTITGNFKARLETSRKMEKTLALIQFKIEEETIKNNPHFEMESRLNLEKLAKILRKNSPEELTDTDFPTLDLDNPGKLTDEEEAIINDLVNQFTTSKPIKRLMEFLFNDGKMYHVNNYILNIHALVPSTADGRLEEFMGRKGKELFDHIETTIKKIGTRYLNDQHQNQEDLDLMFYLWCGPKSPFFGKHAMKTLERYFFTNKETHKEITLYWGENIKNKNFMDNMLKEFEAEKVVYGHTPVDIKKGQKIATPDGRAINIDGGFSEAYLSRGHSLIHTPHSLYAVILPTLEEILEARKKKEPAELLVEQIAYYDEPKKIKDTYQGELLKKRRDELLQLIRQP